VKPIHAHHRRNRLTIAGAGVLVVVLCILALGIGRYYVAPGQVVRILLGQVFPVDATWTDTMQTVVVNVRLPRIVGAVLVGGALSLSGAVYQGVFHNPLVSPDILGVSSGAAVGASVAILMHSGAVAIQISALLCGCGAVALAAAISRAFRKPSPMTLVLSGIIVSALCSSLLSLCQYLANVYEELPNIIFWTLGSLRKVTGADVLVTAPVILAVSCVLVALRWRINLLSLGGKEAQSLGVNAGLLRIIIIICSTILTASAVCISGTIGWVGLIVPHLARLVVGSDHVHSIPAAVLFGSAFMVAVDTLARSLTSAEIPLSVITGFIGAPLFVFIIVRRRLEL
jgi:iron complex transport system permease protein